MRPLIGISSYGRAGARLKFSLPCDYVDAVRVAGGIPVILPPIDGDVCELLGRLHGLLLSGGGDIDPAEYGSPTAHATNYDVNRERDRFEIVLARAALALDLPVLGICRGLQVLNVALGGDLVQHIPDRFGENVLHRHPEARPVPHAVELETGAQLTAIAPATGFTVQSWHHQAVDRLGCGLRPVAWAADGVIEAVESASHAFAQGVQWHPEIDARDQPVARRMFERFVSRSGARVAA